MTYNKYKLYLNITYIVCIYMYIIYEYVYMCMCVFVKCLMLRKFLNRVWSIRVTGFR